MFAATTAQLFGVPMTGAVIYGVMRVVQAITQSNQRNR